MGVITLHSISVSLCTFQTPMTPNKLPINHMECESTYYMFMFTAPFASVAAACTYMYIPLAGWGILHQHNNVGMYFVRLYTCTCT